VPFHQIPYILRSVSDATERNLQLIGSKGFLWKDIDHSLARLKLTDLAIQMRSNIDKEERRIQFENRFNENGNTVPSLILAMKERYAEEGARRAYKIYCEVWKAQGNVKTADFVRAVYRHAISVMIKARTNGIKSEFLMWVTRTSFNGSLAHAHVKGLELRMERLANAWFRKLEAEAKELEHSRRRSFMQHLSHQRPSVTGGTEQGGTPEPLHAAEDNSRLEKIVYKVQNPQRFTTLMISETAEYFGVSPRSVHRWVADRKLDLGGRRGSITIRSIRRWEAKRSRTRPSKQN
jgi:hypothetical protein